MFLQPARPTGRLSGMARWPESLAVETDARTEAVVLRRSARVRRLQLRVGAEGAELVVPNRGTLAQAQAFLNERSLWVLDWACPAYWQKRPMVFW